MRCRQCDKMMKTFNKQQLKAGSDRTGLILGILYYCNSVSSVHCHKKVLITDLSCCLVAVLRIFLFVYLFIFLILIRVKMDIHAGIFQLVTHVLFQGSNNIMRFLDGNVVIDRNVKIDVLHIS